MNIGDITKGGLSHSNPLNKHRKIEKTEKESRPPARPGSERDETPHRDSVAISEAGRRALLLRLHYRAEGRSVTYGEVQGLHDAIVAGACEALRGPGVEIRIR